ncbi:elongation factor tu gtp binding domain-containing protein [Cystoisospora suis]|uniref:Elongation factor tu gtp binding domain-containing protein n=1 Tax=Cystoisospora suis TaxID=483139 RepID=A0A2C6KLI8_9APIC|nr:elongation factor tu gtp binding domain-containing protein [Cystoisospora suis]
MATAGADMQPRSPISIRNVCILAHVDHGKTCLSDRLLSINGLISEASAGKVRYLDSREDEQRRQITIKASVVSLYFRRTGAPASDSRVTGAFEASHHSSSCSSPILDPLHRVDTHTDTNREQPRSDGEAGDTFLAGKSEAAHRRGFVINLVDCPGHVDFASEVSAAVRLCDGGLLLVDAIEGVGPQTLAALQQAWSERVVPLLVLTKMDKLIQKLCLTPAEAYAHCQGIIEQVNAHLHQQIHSELLAGASSPRDTPSDADPSAREFSAENDRTRRKSLSGPGWVACPADCTGEIVYFSGDLEQKLEFSPAQGNVLFISSLHGWCLHLPTFAKHNLLRLLHLPLSSLPRLLPALWGDYYLKRSAKQSQKATGPHDSRPSGFSPSTASSDKPRSTEASRFEIRKAPTHPRQPRIVEQLIFGDIWKMYEAAFAPVEPLTTLTPLGNSFGGDSPQNVTTQSPDRKTQTAPVDRLQANSEKLERLARMVDALELPQPELKSRVKQEVTHLVRMQQEHLQYTHGKTKKFDGGGNAAGKGEEETAEEIVKAIMTRWLPVADIVLSVIVDRIPNPLSAARQRLSYLCPALQRTLGGPVATQLLPFQQRDGRLTLVGASSPSELQRPETKPESPHLAFPKAKPAVQCSDRMSERDSTGVAGIRSSDKASTRPPLVLLYVAKFLGADRKLCRLTGDRLQGTERFSGFVGLCRVFVGTLRRGAALYVCTEDRHTASVEEEEVYGSRGGTETAGDVLRKREVPDKEAGKRLLPSGETETGQREVLYVRQIYMLCGQDMTVIDSAPAGSVIAVSLSRLRRRSTVPNHSFAWEESAGEQNGAVAVDTRVNVPALPLSETLPEWEAVMPDSGEDLSDDEVEGAQGSEEALRDVTAWLQSLRDRNRPLLLHHQQREDRRQRGAFCGASGAVRAELTSLHRCLTLSNWEDCPALITPYSKAASAIVRVAVEPQRLEDAQQFVKGMARLYVADPSIELSVLDSGEFLLGCCGEVHLETCVRDLQGLYAQVPITVSSPMVAIRETVAPSNTPDGLVFAPPDSEVTASPARPPAQFSPMCRRVAFPPWAKATALSTSTSLPSGGLCRGTAGVRLETPGTTVDDHHDAHHEQGRRAGEHLPAVQGGEESGQNWGDEAEESRLVDNSGTRGGTQHVTRTFAASGETSQAGDDSIVTWLSRQADVVQGVSVWTANQELGVLLRAEPMPTEVTDWLTDASREINAVLKSRVPSRRFLQTSTSRSPSSSRPRVTSRFDDARPSELTPLLRTAIERIVLEIRSEWMQRDVLLGEREESEVTTPSRHNNILHSGSRNISTGDTAAADLHPSAHVTGVPVSTTRAGQEMIVPSHSRCPGDVHRRLAFPGNLWGLALTGGACNAFFGARSCRLILPVVSPLSTNATDRQEGDERTGNGRNPSPSCVQTNGGEKGMSVGKLPGGWQEVEALDGWSLAHSYGADAFQLPVGSGGVLSSGTALLRRALPALVSGFELASLSGPLAEEPVRGVAFIMEAIVYRGSHAAIVGTPQRVALPGSCSAEARAHSEEDTGSTGLPEASSVCRSACSVNSLPYGPFSGQVMSTMKEACRKALLQRGRCRIAEAMLRFTLTCEQRVLGKVYGVLSRRRSKILKEGLLEGQTSLFVVEGCLPTAEAAGIARDLRSKASGHASLQMQFSHWEVLDEDPFPEACMTEEEVEDEGEAVLAALASQITARRIINSIRKTKGLPTEEKVVEAAEKQRTLSKNK